MLNYTSKEAADYFSKNRSSINDFYDSEQFILKKLIKNISSLESSQTVLDLGCASGGLGRALKDELREKINYIGIDINPLSVNLGRDLHKDLELIEGDFSKKIDLLHHKKINFVISLSCIDWNDNFEQSLEKILDFCRNKKCDFIFTFRASKTGINNIDESYQFINYNNEKKGEIATYVVLSHELIRSIIKRFDPQETLISAYKGTPSKVAITPYSELIFGCIWLKNCFQDNALSNNMIGGEFPLEIFL